MTTKTGQPTGDRLRSHWGWGWADKFPDREQRKAMGEMAAQTLGFAPSALLDPMPLESVRIAAPRLAIPDEVASFCDASDEARVRHTYGRNFRDVRRGFAGVFENPPDFVASPVEDIEVFELLEWATSHNVAVVPFGGGTSVVGGVEATRDDLDAHNGVVSLDLTRMSRVLEIDETSRAAHIEAGILGPALEAALAPHGLTLRHYPQSFEFSTLGGWLATRSGGHYATGPTHIDEFVESMRVITPRGALETRRLPASGAGPDVNRMMLGSEGALGVITQAWMRVSKRVRYRARAALQFARFDDAVCAARAVVQSGLRPSNCRVLDAREALLNGVSDGRCALLLIAFESAEFSVEHDAKRAVEIALDGGSGRGTCAGGVKVSESRGDGRVAGEGEGEGWRAAFLEAPYLQNTFVSLGMIADTFETACTWRDFAAMHEAIQRGATAILRGVCGGGSLTCRFTHVYPDGPAPYYTFVAPSTPENQLVHWREIKEAVSDILVEHGATITHHHAVGRLHKPWYAREQATLALDALRAAKASLDPSSILNPGALI